jgi:hypothetical protein
MVADVVPDVSFSFESVWVLSLARYCPFWFNISQFTWEVILKSYV